MVRPSRVQALSPVLSQRGGLAATMARSDSMNASSTAASLRARARASASPSAFPAGLAADASRRSPFSYRYSARTRPLGYHERLSPLSLPWEYEASSLRCGSRVDLPEYQVATVP